MEFNDMFWSADINHLKRGYTYDSVTGSYVCLLCGGSFEDGVIYQSRDRLIEAKKAVELHITNEHNSVFNFLLNMDKRYTGLTEHQKELMNHFYEGCSDKEIVKQTGAGSTSTIRNQRFTFREKHKQAKIFLAIMELLEEGMSKKKDFGEKLVEIHGGATMVDERYAITEDEKNTVLKNYFDSSLLKLKVIPPKEKKKIIILQHIVGMFDKTKKYTEKELNVVLKSINEDYATLRRYLIEYGFMDRTPNCSEYWVK
jgi:hypothetical protein